MNIGDLLKGYSLPASTLVVFLSITWTARGWFDQYQQREKDRDERIARIEQIAKDNQAQLEHHKSVDRVRDLRQDSELEQIRIRAGVN